MPSSTSTVPSMTDTPVATLGTNETLWSETGLDAEARILDVGGGASSLPWFLLQAGFRNVSSMDVSTEALQLAQAQQACRIQATQLHSQALDAGKPCHLETKVPVEHLQHALELQAGEVEVQQRRARLQE